MARKYRFLSDSRDMYTLNKKCAIPSTLDKAKLKPCSRKYKGITKRQRLQESCKRFEREETDTVTLAQETLFAAQGELLLELSCAMLFPFPRWPFSC